MHKVISGLLLTGTLILVLSFIRPVKQPFEQLTAVNSNPAAKEQIKWLSLVEAENALKENDKPVLIDLYTDW